MKLKHKKGKRNFKENKIPFALNCIFSFKICGLLKKMAADDVLRRLQIFE